MISSLIVKQIYPWYSSDVHYLGNSAKIISKKKLFIDFAIYRKTVTTVIIEFARNTGFSFGAIQGTECLQS